MALSSEDKKKYMQLAFAEAKKAQRQGEVPIGAILIDPQGQIIGKGYNRRELDQDVSQHAEMIAIRQACKKLGTWRLIDCSLFVTLEPCPMCAGAIINSRIANLYYGALDPKAGAAGSVVDLFAVKKFNHHVHVIRGIYRDESSKMLETFFQSIRKKQKLAKQMRQNSGKNE